MKKRLAALLAAAGCIGAAAGVLFFSAEVAQGVRSGLTLCGQTLVPSLFPFMALAMLVGRSTAAGPLCRILGPLCRRWLRLPESLAPVLLMSFVGGYPVGAKMISGMTAFGQLPERRRIRLPGLRSSMTAITIMRLP